MMIKFALKNMAVKRSKLLLVLLSIVLSASVALLALNVSMQVKDGIVNTAAMYDIIIGPSGSATQLAMNTMFFTDKPLGTIPYSIVTDLKNNPDVNEAVPFAMGDSYNGIPIIGTETALLSGKPLARGELFADHGEVVIGSTVASRFSLAIGDEIISSHGLSEHGAEHEEEPLKVVGILSRTHTAYDNAIFASIETTWEAHDPGEQAVCAVLIRSKSMNAYYTLTKYYGADSALLAINPATVLREVLQNVDLSAQIVYILCAIILVMNLFVIWVITLLNLYDAKREMRLMRLIGVSMRKISRLYLFQNSLIGLAATGLSALVSMLCLALMGDFVAKMGIVLNATKFYPLEWAIMAAVFLISVCPSSLLTVVMARKDSLGG